MEEKLIYGVSSKYEFKRWHHAVYYFRNEKAAEKWLHTQENDFREREIMDSKDAAIKLAGKTAVENAVDWEYEEALFSGKFARTEG